MYTLIKMKPYFLVNINSKEAGKINAVGSLLKWGYFFFYPIGTVVLLPIQSCSPWDPVFTLRPCSQMRLGQPNHNRQPGHIALHTWVYHASPRCLVHHSCSDYITAYVTSARRSNGPLHSYCVVLVADVLAFTLQQMSAQMHPKLTTACGLSDQITRQGGSCSHLYLVLSTSDLIALGSKMLLGQTGPQTGESKLRGSQYWFGQWLEVLNQLEIRALLKGPMVESVY